MRISSGVSEDRGAAVVWALALISVLLMVSSLASAVAVQAIARQRVATIADLAALAGAQTRGEPCRAADDAARANDAQLVSCALDGTDVVVTVRRPAPELVTRVIAALGGRANDVDASARAGPS